MGEIIFGIVLFLFVIGFTIGMTIVGYRNHYKCPCEENQKPTEKPEEKPAIPTTPV